MTNDQNNVDALKNLIVKFLQGVSKEDIPTTTIADTLNYFADNYSTTSE